MEGGILELGEPERGAGKAIAYLSGDAAALSDVPTVWRRICNEADKPPPCAVIAAVPAVTGPT